MEYFHVKLYKINIFFNTIKYYYYSIQLVLNCYSLIMILALNIINIYLFICLKKKEKNRFLIR